MLNVVDIVGEQTAEVTLPKACVTCGGEVQLRVSPEGARAYCSACHSITKVTLGWRAGGLVLGHEVKASA